jgi:VanZ family protein
VATRAGGHAAVKTLWIVFVLFVLYGTTVPFNFAIDHDILERKFALISPNPFIRADTGRLISLADAAQNVLLFLPFGVLGVLATDASRRGVRRIVWVTTLGAALSVSVETLQLFTRERITSTTDVMTNTAGALSGALLAWRFGNWGRRTLADIAASGIFDGQPFYALMLATVLVGLAAWAPLDVSLDLDAVARKLQGFAQHPWLADGLSRTGAEIVQYALWAGAAAAWLCRPHMRRPGVLAAALATLVATLLAASQILIGSRSPGLEPLVARVGGAVLGVFLWRAARRQAFGAAWVAAAVVLGSAAASALEALGPLGLSAASPDTAPNLAIVSRALSVGLLSAPVGFCVGWFLPRATRSVSLTFVAAIVVSGPVDLWGGGLDDSMLVRVLVIAIGIAAAGLGMWCARSGYQRFEDAVRDLSGSQ